jgi:hypothetical protein
MTAMVAIAFGASAAIVPAAEEAESIPAVAAPEAGTSCAISAAPAATGSGGASIASSRGRWTSSCWKRRHVEHVRRWARIRAPRRTRPSPSESRRRIVSQANSRPSLACISPVRAS